jgi:vacuolar-type H+-ATPase subunit E/Vma4
MSHQELIASLRKGAEEKIKAIREESRAGIEIIRAKASEEIKEKRDEYRRKEVKAVLEHERNTISEAEREGALLRLSAEKTMADRLRSLSLMNLHKLRDERYPSLFLSLVKELPPCEWEKVKVNAEDINIARENFPDAEIIPDDSITGGLEVLAEAGAIHIINTLEKRVENIFGDLLPLMVKEIYKEI